MSTTFSTLDQGMKVFSKIRTVGNEGLFGGSMLRSSEGFLQVNSMVHLDSRDTDRVQSLASYNSICFKLVMANECLSSKFDILTNGIFKQQPSSW